MTNEQYAAMLSAETAIVGSILIDPSCLPDVLTQVRPSDFGTDRMRQLFLAAHDLYNEQAPVDPVTILERAGSTPAMSQTIKDCMDVTPTAAHVLRYCEILREQAELARIRDAAARISEARTVAEARDILAEAQTSAQDRPGVSVLSLQDLMQDWFRRMGQPRPDYVHWGLGMLDGMLHTGPGSYVIVAARPSTGKTALGLQLGVEISQHKRVGFYSLETVPEVAADRLAAANLGITLPEIKDRKVDPSTMTTLANQMTTSRLLKSDLEFISASSLSVADIRSMALARRHEVVIIDYVQLIRPSIRADRTQQMQQVSMDLRAMAQMTGLVIVALAQLRRPDTKEKQKGATMADLKESGQFEQDADTILVMYLEDAENRGSDRYIKIEKNKEGYAGFRARFRFDGRKQTFSPVDDDGRPEETPPPLKPADDQMEMEELPRGW